MKKQYFINANIIDPHNSINENGGLIISEEGKIEAIGKKVNIGAGTITCNYDGVKKNKTKIKDKVFIGSNTALVAPVTINEKSIVGAGSVITRNVSKKSLALTRSQQLEIKNYKRKSK